VTHKIIAAMIYMQWRSAFNLSVFHCTLLSFFTTAARFRAMMKLCP